VRLILYFNGLWLFSTIFLALSFKLIWDWVCPKKLYELGCLVWAVLLIFYFWLKLFFKGDFYLDLFFDLTRSRKNCLVSGEIFVSLGYWFEKLNDFRVVVSNFRLYKLLKFKEVRERAGLKLVSMFFYRSRLKQMVGAMDDIFTVIIHYSSVRNSWRLDEWIFSCNLSKLFSTSLVQSKYGLLTDYEIDSHSDVYRSWFRMTFSSILIEPGSLLNWTRAICIQAL